MYIDGGWWKSMEVVGFRWSSMTVLDGIRWVWIEVGENRGNRWKLKEFDRNQWILVKADVSRWKSKDVDGTGQV